MTPIVLSRRELEQKRALRNARKAFLKMDKELGGEKGQYDWDNRRLLSENDPELLVSSINVDAYEDTEVKAEVIKGLISLMKSTRSLRLELESGHTDDIANDGVAAMCRFALLESKGHPSLQKEALKEELIANPAQGMSLAQSLVQEDKMKQWYVDQAILEATLADPSLLPIALRSTDT